LTGERPTFPRPYSPEESAAIVEIQQKIYFYGWCIDHRDFDALDDLFLPDAIVHYDVQDGTRAVWPEMKKWLPEGLSIFRLTQHNMSNPMVELDGDRARSRTYGHLMHFQELASGAISTSSHHAIYHDEWKRSEGAWRIAARTLTNLYVDGPMLRGDDIVSFKVPKPI
jgi:hypothetical protein